MRTFKPLIKIKNKWNAYPNLLMDEAIIFGEKMIKRNQEILFETESFGVTEILNLEQLKQMQL